MLEITVRTSDEEQCMLKAYSIYQAIGKTSDDVTISTVKEDSQGTYFTVTIGSDYKLNASYIEVNADDIYDTVHKP